MEQNSQNNEYNVLNPEKYVIPQENYPNFIAQQIVNEVPRTNIVNSLVEKGMNVTEANELYNSIETQFDDAKRSAAKKDMLWGAVWTIGGLAVTISGVGFIAYGAILFGGIQFVKGLIAYNSI